MLLNFIQIYLGLGEHYTYLGHFWLWPILHLQDSLPTLEGLVSVTLSWENNNHQYEDISLCIISLMTYLLLLIKH